MCNDVLIDSWITAGARAASRREFITPRWGNTSHESAWLPNIWSPIRDIDLMSASPTQEYYNAYAVQPRALTFFGVCPTDNCHKAFVSASSLLLYAPCLPQVHWFAKRINGEGGGRRCIVYFFTVATLPPIVVIGDHCLFSPNLHGAFRDHLIDLWWQRTRFVRWHQVTKATSNCQLATNSSYPPFDVLLLAPA